MYGLNSTYWFSFLNENKGSVLFDVLKDLEYDINIVSSTNTNWPEFRKTAYINVQDSIHDKFTGEPWQKDEQSLSKYLELVAKSTKSQFSFLFLDAPHGYSFPPKENKFKAKEENVNYLTINKDSEDLAQIKARYKNSAFYSDKLFGEIIQNLKERKLYDNSIIIFTADHGEEFYEQGYFGHNTAFTKTQINVPFIIKMPKNKHKAYSALSSHNDMVPTILSHLGVENTTTNYSNGYDLLDEKTSREYVFSANWNNNAIITKDKTYIFSNLPNKMFKNEIRNNETYKRLDKSNKIDTKILLDVMNENRQFLR